MVLATRCSPSSTGTPAWLRPSVTEETRGDLRWGTTPRLVVDAAERFGDADAVVDGDTSISFSELAARVRQAAGALVGSGIGPGDRVAVWAPNVWEWIVAAMGAQAAGAVLVPVNTRF